MNRFRIAACLLCLAVISSLSSAEEQKTILSDDFLTMPGDEIPALREFVKRLKDYNPNSMEEYEKLLQERKTLCTSLIEASEKLTTLSNEADDIAIGQKGKLIALENLFQYENFETYAPQCKAYAEELIRDFPDSDNAIYAQALLLEMKFGELHEKHYSPQENKENYLQQLKKARDEWPLLEKQMKEFIEKHPGVKSSELIYSLTAGPCWFEDNTSAKTMEAWKTYLEQSDLPEAKEFLERFDFVIQNMLTVKWAGKFRRLYHYADGDEQAQNEVREEYRKVLDAKKEEFESDKDNMIVRSFYVDLLECALNIFGNENWLIEHFDGIKQYYLASDDPDAKSRAERLDGVIRCSTLKGNEMEFEAMQLDGTKIDIRDFRGKVVLLDYWATWCGPCIASFPKVEELYEKYRDQGFEVIAYSIDENLDSLREFEKKHPHPWISTSRQLTLDKDGREFADYYGISGIPSYMLIGRDGKVISAATYPDGEEFFKMFEEAIAMKNTE